MARLAKLEAKETLSPTKTPPDVVTDFQVCSGKLLSAQQTTQATVKDWRTRLVDMDNAMDFMKDAKEDQEDEEFTSYENNLKKQLDVFGVIVTQCDSQKYPAGANLSIEDKKSSFSLASKHLNNTKPNHS